MQERQFAHRSHRLRRMQRRLAISLSILGLSPGCNDQKPPASTEPVATTPAPAETSTTAPVDPLESIRSAIQKGDLASASEQMRSLMISRPDDSAVEVLRIQLAIAQKRYAEAIESIRQFEGTETTTQDVRRLIGNVVLESPEAAAGHAQFCWIELERILKARPQEFELRRSLVRLLNLMGHRHRACQHIDWLCAAGQAHKEQLLALIARRDCFPLDSTEETFKHFSQESPLALARLHYSQNRFIEAFDILKPIAASGWKNAEDAALFGEVLAQLQAFDEMPKWLRNCPPNCQQYAEYWSAIGLWLESQSKFSEASGAFLAAIEIDPTHLNDYRHLSYCLRQTVSDKQTANALVNQIADRAQKIQTTVAQVSLASSDGNGNEDQSEKLTKEQLSYLVELSKFLNDLGRPLEFLAWQISLSREAGAPESRILGLNQQRIKLLQIPDFAYMNVIDRRMGLTKNDYPAPGNDLIKTLAGSSNTSPEQDQQPSIPVKLARIQFDDIASSIGLDFQYQNRFEPRHIEYRIHESLGGGLGAIDYDLDGHVDLFCSQASGEPPERASELSNQLFRNTGKRFIEQTQAALLNDDGYSTGVAIGDVNQDGFPDLYVGALGQNRLFINQGDGTFSERFLDRNPRSSQYTASLAIADITGDGLADIIEANYVNDPDIFIERPVGPNGVPPGTSPLDYAPAKDCVWIASPSGEFNELELEMDQPTAAASLGLIVADFDSNPGNEIFIANDAYSNRYWVRNNDAKGELGFSNQAALLGLALDYSRTETAGMGVASADFDGNGRLDLHVTNFWQQSSTLYLQQSSGLFQDAAPKFGLGSLTYALLGFGTQSIDVNQDGKRDLIVLNGHIEDYSVLRHPYEMPPQILVNEGNRFDEYKVNEGNYFSRNELGRSLLKMDWNGDGQMDLVAGHLHSPIALLENRSQSPGKWIQIQCVGTECGRDAIGAKVEVLANKQRFTGWLVAGDGYQCSNEHVIDIGLGAIQTIDEIVITWPNGTSETLSGLMPNHRYLLIQGQSTAELIDSGR